ncbi:ABC transporter permease [Virgibacillus salinus]|uniref:ABC-type antimicrobial peptide transport system, permease component n=1 Tax=Virgibacillus salinus TaxID=553311 RepID=A0A1H1EZA9_9BACI|nr:ABC transporter permease [Virgibacillus salinus]SDQ93839.1 ABC-type antimicrobial peptide transport system, permease component [Virgibacillus salinus]
MLKFIWNSWWRNKERFILLIIGALIVSIGLSYLVGITQASNATVVDELQKRWKSSYHIVVRPPDSRSVTEDRNLLEPNYLSGLDGGITLDQYEKIKTMTDVEVAAPIAMMGYMRNSIQLDSVTYTEPGIYRVTIENTTNTGVEQITDEYTYYFTEGWGGIKEKSAGEYGVTYFDGMFEYGTEVLIAGIDPETESALVGIDEAIIKDGNSQFLSDEDKVEQVKLDTKIPVIMSNKEFVDGKRRTTVEKLNISFKGDPSSTMKKVKEYGGEDYLEKQPGKRVDQFIHTTEDTHQKIVNQISDGSYLSGSFNWMPFRPSSVNYREVRSPFRDRWPFAYEVEPYIVPEESLLAVNHAYRPISMFSDDSSKWPRLQLDFKGVFDPRELDVSKDPLTELPMETYFPSKAKWVLDKHEQPVNPPQLMKPLNNPYGFLTKPPLMLTTIDAAAEVLGDAPISAIRLKVNGVEELTEDSEQLLQEVAQDIEDTTGLITDVTLGSSPQPALAHIPGVEEKENLGWVEQPWIKLGSSVTIFKESQIGMSGVIGSVILVAVVYVFSSNIIMMYARKKEFAVLLSVGWRPNQLTKLLFIEAALIGLFVSLISWLILGSIYVMSDIQTSALRLFLIGILGITIYVLGTFIPGVLVRKISPYETMKAGEVTNRGSRLFKTTTIFRMSLKNLLSKWKRSILSIISIALPTSLLIFFLFITLQLRGTMFTTWLGEYVAMEVGTMHYIAMGVAIAIAILTTAEIIWQNVAERQPELAVLKAVGWQNHTIRMLVLIEGGLNGLFAGVIGLGIAFGMIYGMYGQFPVEQIPFFLATILIPVVTGIIGAILPAQKAGKIQPYQGLNGGLFNSKKTEKSFKYAFGVTGTCLFLGIVIVLTQAIPDVQKSATSKPVDTSAAEGTTGDVQESFSQIEEESPQEEELEKDDSERDFIQDKIDNAYRVYVLGEPFEYGEDEVTAFNLVSNPEGIQPESDDTDLITVASERIRRGGESGGTQYQPHLGYHLFDEQGNEYEAIDYEVVEAENWNKISLRRPGKLKILLTYEVPKDAERLILYGYHSWMPRSGEIVVEIK